MRPQHNNAPPGKGAITRQQHLQGGGAHHTRLVPAGKGDGKVACACCQHNPVKADQPRPFCICKANNLLWQALHPRPVTIHAPCGGAEQQLNASFHRLFKIRHAHEDGFEHPIAILRRGRHAAPEIERRIIAHQRAGHRIFIHQKHRSSAGRAFGSGGNAAWPCANDNKVICGFGRASCAIDGAHIGSGKVQIH